MNRLPKNREPKVPASPFSIERSAYAEFCFNCENENKTKSEVLRELIKQYNKEQAAKNK